MPTAFHQIDLPELTRSVSFEARVGAATWLLDLDHHALDVLNDSDIALGPASVARIMENVKAKVVAMRWFGGGRIAVGADELTLPAPGPIRMDDGSERMPTPWFQLVDVRGRSRAARRLQSVA
jgi:hypothetical protein